MGGGVGGEYGAGVGGRDGLADVGSCVGIGSGLGAGVLCLFEVWKKVRVSHLIVFRMKYKK